MASGRLALLTRYLHHAALLQNGAGLNDGQLLERFLVRREEAAFSALVRRHGPMVLGVCRRVLRNAHDAEDAFQATFLVLVRKAQMLLPRANVGGWLYGVAHNIALKARALATRRRQKERQAWEIGHARDSRADAAFELSAALDKELHSLPARYRELVVLCDIEGNTRREAARQLGLPEGTVSSRLARARIRLAKGLTGRGISLSTGALALLLSKEAMAALPPCLPGSTLKAASLAAAGKILAGGVISPQVAALTQGVLKSMVLAKLKISALLLAALVTCAGMGMRMHGAVASAGASSAGDSAAKPASQLPAKVAPRRERDLERRLTLPVSIHFRETPLASIVDDMRALTGINIELDRAALHKLGLTDRILVSIQVSNVSVKSALQLIMRGVHPDLDFRVQDEKLVITAWNSGKELKALPLLPPATVGNKVRRMIEVECKVYKIERGQKQYLMKPSVTTRDGCPAKIVDGGQIPIKGADSAVVYEDVGIRVQILVSMHKNGTAHMEVTLENRQAAKTEDGLQVHGTFVRSIQTSKPGAWVRVEEKAQTPMLRHGLEVRITRITEETRNEVFSIENERK